MCRFSLSERDRSVSTAMSGHVFQGRRGVKVWALLAHMSRRLLTLPILCNSCIAMVVYSSRMAVSPTRVMKSRGVLEQQDMVQDAVEGFRVDVGAFGRGPVFVVAQEQVLARLVDEATLNALVPQDAPAKGGQQLLPARPSGPPRTRGARYSYR